MQQKLFTAGYEGKSVDVFIADLCSNGIDCIIDVRALPLSRKKGFSKTQLAKRLKAQNIRYIHLGSLGTPKEVRNNLKLTHDYESFFETMNNYLADKTEAIESAYNYVINNKCCLMCYERLIEQCHRKLVAEKIKNQNGDDIRIIHI